MNYARRILAAGAAYALLMSASAHAADVVVADPGWPMAKGVAYIIKKIAEQDLGLTVEIQNGTNPIIWEAMDKGSMDIHPEVTMPNQQNFYDKYVTQKGTVTLSKNAINDLSEGMCVPRYVAEELHVTKLTDLANPDKAKLFDTDGDGKGEVWIGESGWNSSNVEKVRARDYGYDQTMKTEAYDETLANEKLAAAVRAHKPIVRFCYSTSYTMKRYDLAFLEDLPYDPTQWHIVQPNEDPNWLALSKSMTAKPKVSLTIAFRSALKTEHPEVARLVENMDLNLEDKIEMATSLSEEKMSPDDYAKKWVTDHKDRVAKWLSE